MIFDEVPYDIYRKGDKSRNYELRRCTFVSAPQLPGRVNARKNPAAKLRGVYEVLEAEGLNPTEEILRVLQEGTVNDNVRIATWLALLEFCQPRLKAVAVNVNNRPIGELTEAQLFELAGIAQIAGGGGTAGPSRGEVVPFRLRAADEFVPDAIETPPAPTDEPAGR